MKTAKFNFLRKKEFLIIIIGVILSFIIATYNINKFDKNIINSNGQPDNLLLKSDLSHSWEMADQFRSNLEQGESFFKSFPIYDRTLLQPILIGYYYYILGESIYEKNQTKKKIIKTGNFKIGILYIQILIFYFSVFFLTRKLSKKIDNKYIFILTLFLCVEPTMIQWHSSFWTESLFLSMTIFLLGIIIDLPKKILFHYPIGILLGLMYMQKAIGIFLIVPIIFYYVLIYKKKILPIIILLFGYISLILFVGINHYKKTNVFFITSPMHAYYSYYHYFAHRIHADRMGIDIIDAKKKLTEKENEWKKSENVVIKDRILDSDKEQLAKNINYRNRVFLNEVIKNPIYTLEFFTKKIIIMSILHPSWVYESFVLDKSSKLAKENPKKYFHQNFKKNLVYSSIIYFFVIVGVIVFLKKIYIQKKIDFFDKLLILNILFILYYIAVAGPWGNPRYFTPCLINLSIFFSYGFNHLKGLLNISKI